MKKAELKRRCYAWLLLSVFALMTVAVGLHRHEVSASSSAEEECVQCAHHVHHDGHLKSPSAHLDDCVLCQLASLPFIYSTTIFVLLPSVVATTLRQHDAAVAALGVRNTKSTRAPPCLVFNV